MSALLVSFEPLTGHHIIEIAAIEQRTFPDYPLSYGDLITHLGKGARGWIIKSGGKIIAYVLVTIGNHQAHLLKLGVTPEHRGKGLGKKLLERVVGLARQSGARELVLEVAESNAAAIRFYANREMKEQGRLPDYYPRQGGREDALIMSMDI